MTVCLHFQANYGGQGKQSIPADQAESQTYTWTQEEESLNILAWEKQGFWHTEQICEEVQGRACC